MAEVRFYVGVHGVIANRGRMLVLRRAPTMRYAPGAWDLPGGIWRSAKAPRNACCAR